MKIIIVNIYIIVITILLAPPLLAKSNQKDVRSSIRNGGWQVIWGEHIDHAKQLKFVTEIGLASGCIIATASTNQYCYTRLGSFFHDQLILQVEHIANELSVRTNKMVNYDKWELAQIVVRLLQRRETIFNNYFELTVGVAAYNNWTTTWYKEPRTYKCKQKIIGGIGWFWSICSTMVTKKSDDNLPNTYQPYIKYRLRN